MLYCVESSCVDADRDCPMKVSEGGKDKIRVTKVLPSKLRCPLSTQQQPISIANQSHLSKLFQRHLLEIRQNILKEPLC